MNNPVLSIDVSKSKSFAASFLAYEKPLSKPFPFSNSLEGTKVLSDQLNKLETQTGIKPEIVLEATGNYSKPITDYFIKAGYNVVVLNPILTHQQKAKSIRKIKTDPIDVARIAKVYYLNKHDVYHDVPDDLAELQSLARQYEGLMQLYTETQLRMQSLLDLVFPNYHTVFDHLCGKASLSILQSYPSPNDVLEADRGDLFKIIKTCALGHSADWCNKAVDRLLAAAGESLPNNNRISKRGSSYLRKALYQATIGAISKRKNGPANPILFNFYTKKRSEGKAPKVAIIATSSKLLRIIYGILKTQRPFSIDR